MSLQAPPLQAGPGHKHLECKDTSITSFHLHKEGGGHENVWTRNQFVEGSCWELKFLCKIILNVCRGWLGLAGLAPPLVSTHTKPRRFWEAKQSRVASLESRRLATVGASETGRQCDRDWAANTAAFLPLHLWAPAQNVWKYGKIVSRDKQWRHLLPGRQSSLAYPLPPPGEIAAKIITFYGEHPFFSETFTTHIIIINWFSLCQSCL